MKYLLVFALPLLVGCSQSKTEKTETKTKTEKTQTEKTEKTEKTKTVDPDFKMTGKKLYQLHCASCHSIDGTIKIGPSLKGLHGQKVPVFDPDTDQTRDVLADEAYLRESTLLHGKLLSRRGMEFKDLGSSQGFDRKFTAEDMDLLIGFIKSVE